jgi:prepilin-type N-terminal cleavage/methylation domain-containing protein
MRCKTPRTGARRGRGYTLVEMLIAIVIMGMIATAAGAVLNICLRVEREVNLQASLQSELDGIINRVSARVKTTQGIYYPNAYVTQGSRMILAASINNDGDDYFGDARFPRFDEDPGDDLNNDGYNGVRGLNDDGDLLTDEYVNLLFLPAANMYADDDEDNRVDEDPLNGLDDDGDGMVDEDPGADANGDGYAGFRAVDDNGDGVIDNGASAADDDEDGTNNEDPVELAEFKLEGTTLRELIPATNASVVLSARVRGFQVAYEAPTGTRGGTYMMTIKVGERGAELTRSVRLRVQNVLQFNGRIVR